MSITVENLTKMYGEQKAIDNISFSIGTGEIVGFLGPNGAGKSTTMKILTGYLQPSGGSANILGMDIADDSLSIRKKIGYLPELNPLYADMYVKEYLSFNAQVFQIKDRKKRVDEVIEITGLALEKNKKISQLSKGYKQRVGLAQALLNNPDVLILDEPTSGLDPNQMTEIRSLITDLGKEKTILLSSHIMQEIEAMCSRVIIINRGKIVADDQVQDVKRRMSSGFKTTRVRFRDEINLQKLEQSEGFIKVTADGQNAYIIKSENNVDVAQRLFDFAIASETIILEQQEQSESLETVFQQLTKNV